MAVFIGPTPKLGRMMRAKEFVFEKINPEIIESDFYAEKSVDLPGVGPLKFVAKNYKPGPYTPQFIVKVYQPNGQSIAHFRFLVMDYEESTGFRFLSKFKKQKDPYVIGANVSVWNEFQRKGIARAVYQWVKSMGNDLKPSPTQTDAGRAMWRGFEKSPIEEGPVLDAQSLVDVFVKGRHGNNIITKLIAREFPNNRLERLIQLLVDKYDVNPNAIVYGPSRKTTTNQSVSEQELEERKKRRKQSRWAFSGPGGWYGYYYGHSGEGAASDGGGGESVAENFADGKVKGKSRPGRVKRSGASCSGSVTDLRARAQKYGGERGRMYHWCANMKSGRKK
jgi:hypothetical protein